jgi:hypothetical protein
MIKYLEDVFSLENKIAIVTSSVFVIDGGQIRS